MSRYKDRIASRGAFHSIGIGVACGSLACATACEAIKDAQARWSATIGRIGSSADFARTPKDDHGANLADGKNASWTASRGMGPERASGPNRSHGGADALLVGRPIAGRVSFKEGNRTDWHRLVLDEAGLYSLEFRPGVGGNGIDAEIYEDGVARPLKAREDVEVLNPRNIYVRVVAPEPLSHGNYELALTPARSQPAAARWNGLILRFNGTHATLDLGAEDGVRPGLRGEVVRNDSSVVGFVIKRVLKRSSSAELEASLGPEDIGARARILEPQASLTPRPQ
jgi:hypothetical protein